ncbi:TetR/AcrR family transcriptional regulator [Actinoplanes palleronii]|uniref:TetR family transcriptional regulator n=1 Tax=Actinoplanes palleronii TaxID=113570 RepID=A0ABQ4BS49_9ACTN|nr:TetR/AcrR family transcriptional regulator [Actinoplanes palleronii]GIE73015.1 TetR family transcriptional regulator [Actinoplanes palleronii]
MDAKSESLRERTRRAVQAELTLVAIDLFVEQGYDATPVEQIAEAAGMSRRSFHRYFGSKDEVMVAVLAASGERLTAALAERPAGEPPWTALRRSFDGIVERMADPRSLAITRMMRDSPSLHASHLHRQTSLRKSLADVLAARLPDDLAEDQRRLGAAALAASALACLEIAQSEWSDHDGRRPLAGLLDIAMNSVTPM